ncbi:DNA polymerase I [Fundidesulfovibrio butyratiphilus]
MPLRDRLPTPGEPLYLIDGTSYIYRGFYAFGDLTRSDGFPTNALFSVLRLGLRLLREERPTHALFILDGRGPNFRHELFAAYKAQREAMPEPLVQQLAPIAQGLELMGLPVYRQENMEADDAIASLAARYKAKFPVVIVGSDKDLRQCLDASVVLWDPSGKQEKFVTLSDFMADFPQGPAHWPDFQALTGDASDNIPGVPGVGPKTAATVLTQFPTLEALKDGLEDLKPNIRAKIAPHLDDLFTYRELTRLRTDAAQDVTLDSMAVRPARAADLATFLASYELRTLAREAQTLGLQATPAKASPSFVQGRSAQTPAGPAHSGQEQLSLLPPKPAVPAPDLDPDPPTPPADLPDLSGAQVALVHLGAEQGFCLGLDTSQYTVTRPAAELVPLLARAQRIHTPSVKELLGADPAWSAVPLDRFFDLGLAAYLLSPEDRVYSWERLADSLFTDPTYSPDEAPPGRHGLVCLALGKRLSVRVEQAGLGPLLAGLEQPLIPVLVRMERLGVGIDPAAFAAFAGEVNAKLDELSRAMHDQAGVVFNLRSSQQLADVLYNRLGLKTPGKTPGGAASTSAEVLERLRGQHPLVDSVLEFRKLEKLRSTYLEPLPRLAGPDGRIHTTFNQLATATGRLSSSNPNLQNIPVRGALGRRMRACFVAAPGHVLASADYSQIELRVLAHFSKDPALLEAFRQGQDIHTRTAALLFDASPEKITPAQRRQAKTINFGLLYGMGPQKLGRELGLTLARAKDFIAKYFERLSTLKAYYQQVVDQAEAQGYVTTLAGRRRLLPDIRSRNAQLKAQANRQAVNTVIQGSAADIIKMAMLATDNDAELERLGARLVLQVHDELVIEAPEANGRPAGERLRTVMSDVTELDAPLVADMGVGRDWAGAH